jgi:hypothetical protein
MTQRAAASALAHYWLQLRSGVSLFAITRGSSLLLKSREKVRQRTRSASDQRVAEGIAHYLGIENA